MRTFKHIKTKEVFVERASKLHKNKYNYSKVEFPEREMMPVLVGHRGGGTIATFRKPPEYYREAKITIICPKHGEFAQVARKHIERKAPSGCPYCARELTTKIRIDHAKKQHFLHTNLYEERANHITIKNTASDGIERKILIDKEDLELLDYTNWRTTGHQKSRMTHTNYCIGSPSSRLKEEGYGWLGAHPKIHRLIMSRILARPLLKKELIDHKDGNGLNNRRENLRIATRSQNAQNQRKWRRKTSSQYKGVCWLKDRQLWVAYIGGAWSQSRKYLGRFKLEEEAAVAYDKKAVEYYEEFANLNFPERLEEYLAIIEYEK